MNAVIEAVGYTGSLLIVISMLMTSVKKLRIVNTAGSIIFTTYALIIKSYPTALMNLCLIIINFVNIYRLYKAGKTYTVIECYKNESIVQLYLKQNLPDIKKFFPDFSPEAAGNSKAFFIFTGSMPIGIAIGEISKNSNFNIELDYTIPSHRDYTVAKFLYAYLKSKYGIKKVFFKSTLNAGDTYLEKMNFKKTEAGFMKEL